MRSSTETLIAAAKQLAVDIQSDDGIANMALREIAERLEELSRWIPITERLPDHDIPVLFCCLINGEFGFVELGWYAGNKTEGDAIAMETSVCSGDWLPCTHWRPLPEVPEVTE